MTYGYRGVNIFLTGANVHSRVNLVHFEVLQLEPYETYMMKLTCCTAYWNMGHTVSRHIAQIGMYFILRNNWDIYVLWNISKILYWIFFFWSTHGFDIELYDIVYIMKILHMGNRCSWLAHTLCKCLNWHFFFFNKNCLAQPWLSFGILQVLQSALKFLNLHYFHLLGRCNFFFKELFRLLKFLPYWLFLFLFSVDWWYTLMELNN